jgi:hypothetical protein
MRKFVAVILLLALASISYGAVGVIADFETGLDNFNNTWEPTVTLAQSTTGATLGTQALEVNPVDTYTGGWTWACQWEEGTNFAAAQAGPNPRLIADITVIPSEWASDGGDWDIWLQLNKIAIQGDGLGWTEFLPDNGEFSVYGEQATADIHQKTITWDLSALDWSTVPSSPTWVQIIFSTNFGTNGGTLTSIGNFYFDNVRIETDAPIEFTPWIRYECEDALLEDTYWIGDDVDCSNGQFVQLEKEPPDYTSGNGQITVTVNVPTDGSYAMRIGQNTGGDLERYAALSVNGTTITNIFSGSITWPVEDAIEGVNDWDDALVIEELFASVVLYGEDTGDWQLWDRWAAEWNQSLLNTPMVVDLLEGNNTINIFGSWAWDRWDFIEVEVGYIPKNPAPADGGIAVIDLDTELAWQNAVSGLDKVEVWFGETPEYNETDPNSVITRANYKTILSLETTIDTPGDTSSIPMPNLQGNKDYTWIVEGFKNVPEGEDPNYPGVFWTFFATDNAAPIADAGPDQYVWLDPNDVVVTLDGSASDDGDPGPDQPLIYRWTQLAGPAVTIDDPNALVTTVTITELGNDNEPDTPDPYEFELRIEEELIPYWVVTDTVMVYVNTNSCLSTQQHPDGYLFYGDITGPEGTADQMVPDCKVDLYDFYEIALNWLNCSNMFEACP